MRKVALMTKKILVTEDLVQEGIDSLTEHGYEVDMLIDPTAEELASAIAPYDALIVHPNTVVDSSLLDAAENLRIIGRAGVTVDNIDIEAASERGVIVCNAPNSNVISAAEHTMALCSPLRAIFPRQVRLCTRASGGAPISWAASCSARRSPSSVWDASAALWPSGPRPSA